MSFPPERVIRHSATGDSWWQRWFRGVWRTREREDWTELVGPAWADQIMDVQVTDDFHSKQGRSTGRWVVQGNGQKLSVYLKRHYQLPWWQGLLASLFPGRGWSPALAEWKNLEWAEQQGFPVPALVAAGERIGPGRRLQSVLVIEELPDMLPLHQAVLAASRNLPPAWFARWKRGLIAELARLCRALHQHRHFHKDLYLCHFFIPRQDTQSLPRNWQGRVAMIDFHRLGYHPWTWRWWLLKDLGQLLYSSDVPGVTARDRLRFWHYYFGAERRAWINRWLAWAVRLKGRLYKRHNIKKEAVNKVA